MELWTLLAMLVVFAVACFALRWPTGVGFLLSALAGAVFAGKGVPIRHLVEGTFAYLDAMLIIATAMIFMNVLRATGALGFLNRLIVLKLAGRPLLFLMVSMLFAMFPGLLTGLSSTCVLTTGALIAPTLVAMGMPPATVGAFIAMAGVFGMIGPPINLPVMIIGAGVDMPYVGFDLPLLVATLPLALATAVLMGYRYVRRADVAALVESLPAAPASGKVRLLLPLLVVAVLLVAARAVPRVVPDLGLPLVFVLGSVVGSASGTRVSLLREARQGVREAAEIMALLAGVGMFVQVMALTGARGALAVETLRLPTVLLFVGLGLVMPAFGSAFASATILGVPVLLALLGYNEIIVAAALSLIGGVGDLMPPPMLLCAFAAPIVGERERLRILQKALPYLLLTVLVGIGMLVGANGLAVILRVR